MPGRTFTTRVVQKACDEGESEKLRRVYEGDWKDKGKYSHREIVLQAKNDERFYCYVESRSGSYFSDYTYSWEWEKDEIELIEVHEVKKTIVKWEAV